MSTKMRVVIFSLFSVIGASTVTFKTLEDWTWIQSFYFSVVTLTTVGYGDLSPSTDESRLAATVFILIGVGIVVSALSIVGNTYIDNGHKRRQRK